MIPGMNTGTTTGMDGLRSRARRKGAPGRDLGRMIDGVLVVLIGVTLAGCAQQDPRFVAKTAERTARIQGYLDQARAREAESEPRLAALQDVLDSIERRRQVNLDRTTRLIEQRMHRRRAEWPQRWAKSRADIQDRLDGDPANIDPTIPRMFY
jgi:hypothetical protein